MGNWKLKLQVEDRLFRENIRSIIALSAKSIDEILKDCGITFLQSAAKATPEAKLKQRKLIAGDKRSWVVPFKRIGASGFMKSKYSGRGSIFFHDENEAQLYRKITFKGIHKFGWSANLFTLGKVPTIKNPNLLALAGKIAKTIIKKANWMGAGAEITISNNVKLIGDWADCTRKEGLFKANNRLGWQLSKLQRKFERAWK